MMAITIAAIPVYQTNYSWAVINQENHHCAIIDCGQAQPIINFLQNQSLQLCAILITHHHFDHSNDITALINYQSVPVYGPSKEKIIGITHPLSDNQTLALKALSLVLTALELPGHTIGQIAYYGNQRVFTGDTLFSAGCGKMFEGKPQQFWHSLSRLAALPPETGVYCGHEYTVDNLAFAKQVEPENEAIAKKLKLAQALRKQQQITLPSTIGEERRINPFLRCREATVIKAAQSYCGRKLTKPYEVFQVLRAWKDQFNLR